MPIELRILGGARSGHTETFEKSVIAVGRHPMSDLKFDPKQDLDVSTRHGEIRLVDGRYAVYDAQSTNGTFVNGQRVSPGGMRELKDQDVIAFGAQGPTVAVRIASKTAALAGHRSSSDAPPSPPPPPAPPSRLVSPASDVATMMETTEAPAPRRRPTGERVALAVAEQTRRLRIILVVAVVVLGGVAGGVFYKSSRDNAASTAQIEKLLGDYEQARKQFEVKVQGDTALSNTWRRRYDSLAHVAREARGAQQAAATEQLRRNHELQLRLNEMNPTAIVAANEKAMALITAQVGGKPSEATGFVVTTSGLVVTNRHVVIDSLGNKATRIFVKLAKNSGTHRAHVVRMASDSIDLAVLQIEGSGPFPSVRVAGSVDVLAGAPIVTLGFPLGTDLPMEGSTVEPSLTLGVVSRAITDLLQIDAWATHGASGSPVFDNHGHVIGVVWGGAEGLRRTNRLRRARGPNHGDGKGQRVTATPRLSPRPVMIRKLPDGRYRLYSRKKDPKTGKRRNLGTFKTRTAAEKHERAVQFFKRGG